MIRWDCPTCDCWVELAAPPTMGTYVKCHCGTHDLCAWYSSRIRWIIALAQATHVVCYYVEL